MKHLCSKITLVGIIITAFTSCKETYEDLYQDPSEQDTEEAAYSIVLNDLLSPAFRLIELAEIYTGYQEIRSDREQALEYIKGYLGTQNWVYYEYMDIDRWGKIELNNDGSFTAKPDYWRYYWIAGNLDLSVNIQSPEVHIYIATSTGKDNTYSFTAKVEDGTITMTDLSAYFKMEIYRTSYAKLDILEPLEMPMCKNGKRKLEPISGKIKIDYSSSAATKKFKVEFHESNKTFILHNGTSRLVESEKTYGHNEY